MSGAMHPLPPYAFVACKRITLFFSYCVGLENLIFTAQDSGKSVKMVTPTFRRKFMQQYRFPSRTIKVSKLSRNVEVFYHFVMYRILGKV